ncbi:unnamed protein product [Sphenostylis stenocarpa]|uniref:Uncharacterized protein n=1 Tax=Sphenostylis stenocarpa TaxID=92480 RepID=A0AA86RWP9_9FABA|nr:unnamed protein product [Sphenostylis stenocarpa]
MGSFVVLDGHDSEDPKQSTADMTVFVQKLLQQMLARDAFEDLIKELNGSFKVLLCGYVFLNVNALDEMGNRINDLEQSINDLRAEMGVESTPSPEIPASPAKPKEEESNKEEGSA